jgi:hypothetical protein
MKMLMQKFAVWLPITLVLAACGQLKDSEKKSLDPSVTSSTSFSLLSTDEFKNQCTQKGGIISGTNCIYVSSSKVVASGSSATLSEYAVGTLPYGAALLVQFDSLTGSSFELYLNNALIAAPASPRTTNGGELKYRVSPGAYPTMRIFIYECRNQAWQNVRCPYAAL